MRYCGLTPVGSELLQLVTLEEVRPPEPPILLRALFYEPGGPADVVAELVALGEVVVALGAQTGSDRMADHALAARGIAPAPPSPAVDELVRVLPGMGRFTPDEAGEGPVPEGAYGTAPLIETNPEGVFFALQGRRLPARRHPFGIELRVSELADEQVVDDGGDLWHRRIEELEAVAAALGAHRYAVGHACWTGDPADGVVVLPGSELPEHFATDGVVPAVERLPLTPGR